MAAGLCPRWQSRAFPSAVRIDDALRALGAPWMNTYRVSLSGRARRIIKANDDGDFEEAWRVAEEAFL